MTSGRHLAETTLLWHYSTRTSYHASGCLSPTPLPLIPRCWCAPFRCVSSGSASAPGQTAGRISWKTRGTAASESSPLRPPPSPRVGTCLAFLWRGAGGGWVDGLSRGLGSPFPVASRRCDTAPSCLQPDHSLSRLDWYCRRARRAVHRFLCRRRLRPNRTGATFPPTFDELSEINSTIK